MSTGDHLRLTDDMTVGALIGNTSNGVYHFMQRVLYYTEGILGYNFTNIDTIYSQLNFLGGIPADHLPYVVRLIEL